MFGWNRLSRRSKLMITAGAGAIGVGAVYGAKLLYNSYVEHLRLEEEYEEQERKYEEEQAEENVQNHYDSIQRISDSTTLPSILPHLKDKLYSRINIDELTTKLMQAKEQMIPLTQEEKYATWEQLKLLSFNRAASATLSSSLLAVFLRVQLNLLGRYLYLDSVLDQKAGKSSLSKACQHKFLSYADFLPNRGVEQVAALVQDIVEDLLREVNLKAKLTAQDTADIFTKVARAFVEAVGGSGGWAALLLPPPEELEQGLRPPAAAADPGAAPPSASTPANLTPEDQAKLRSLLAETRACVESSEFAEVMGAASECCTGFLQEKLQQIYDAPDQPLPLPKLIPLVAQKADLVLTVPCPVCTLLGQMPVVDAMCARLYSSQPQL